MNQLAHSRNRRNAAKLGVANIVRTRGTASKSWTPTLLMMGGAALGGIAMYHGHVMSGAALMAGGLIGGSLYEGNST